MKARHYFGAVPAFFFVTMFLASLAGPARAGERAKGFNLGAHTGAGYDSNMFNTDGGEQGALLNETGAKFTFDHKFAKRITFKNGVGMTSSYRTAGANAKALKLNAKGSTGLSWRVFGGGGAMTGIFDAKFDYSGTFNPSLANPNESAIVIDEEDEIDDSWEDDVFADEGDFADDFSYDEDSDEWEDGEFDEEDFFEGDELGKKFFNSKPARHNYTGSLGLTFKPFKPTSFNLTARAIVGDIEERAGQVTSDYIQYGGGFTASQKLFGKFLKLEGGYTLGLRYYDEKRVTAGDKLRMVAHGGSLNVKVRPFDRFKILTGYRLGFTTVPVNTARNALQHLARVDLEYLLLEHAKLSVFGDNDVMFSTLPNGNRSTFRYQALAGLRWRFN